MSLVRMIAEHHHFGASLFAALAWVLQSGASSLLDGLAFGSGRLVLDLRRRIRAFRRSVRDALRRPIDLLRHNAVSHARALDDVPRIRFHRLCVLRQ